MPRTVLHVLCAALVPALAAGCAGVRLEEPVGTPRRHTVYAATEDGALIRFNAGTPGKIDARVRLVGLRRGESIVGIDFRVARGQLYGLTSAGRLLRIDPGTGAVTPLGDTPVPLSGERFGFDFNPTVDRIRVVGDSGLNLRLHPDTGAVVATDPALKAADDAPGPRIAAAAYTYNKQDEKVTTNYAIDVGRGWLVVQGSIEGRAPAVSPNTGLISGVGPLGTGPLQDASFDIADIDNTAYAALRAGGRTHLYAIDLTTGAATLLGAIDRGAPVRGIAIEP